MKTINRKIVTLALTLLAVNVFAQPTPPGFAIAAQGTNIVLNWRSSTNKIYLLEHRATLAGTVQWGELTNYFPAAANQLDQVRPHEHSPGAANGFLSPFRCHACGAQRFLCR